MSSAVDTEVFIPKQASVITVPVNSLPSSITKKISVSPGDSDRPATFISPVELRQKGTTQKPRPLTPGKFFLPVVTSNREAFGMLRKFLQSGEISLQNSRADSAFSGRKNSIVLFDEQIFLIVRKTKASDWPLKQPSSAPSECEAPPLNPPVKTQDGGSDITEGRSNEGTRGAEDHGKYAEKRSGDGRDVVMECDAQDDDITDRKGSKDGAGAAEDHGKCAEVLKEREGDVMKDREENETQTPMKDASMNTSKDKRIKLEEESGVYAPDGEDQSSLANAKEYKDGGSQITSNLRENFNPEITSEQGCASETRYTGKRTGNEKRSENPRHGDDKTKMSKGESSLAKAKCCKRLIFSRVQSPSLMNVNERQDKSDVKGQISEFKIPSDKTKASVSAAEIIADRVSQNITNEDGANSKSYISIQASEGQSSRCESGVEVVHVNDDDCVPSISSDDENAVVPNLGKVENLLEIVERLKQKINDCVNSQGSEVKFKKSKTDDIVVETDSDCDDLVIVESCAEVDGSSTDEPNRNASDDKRHVHTTGAKSKREVMSSAAAAKGCESAVEIVDVDDDRVLRKRRNDASRDEAGSRKSRVCPSPSVKLCEGDVEIVDLNDDDEVIINDRELVNEHRRRFGDVAKGCKRKIFDRIKDETNSDVASAAQISEAIGSSAKRSKRHDVNLSSERKPLESAVESNSQVKNYNRDVEIIEVDDEIHRRANDRNENNVAAVESCANETTVQRNRGNAEDLSDKVSSRGREGENVESQRSLEKIKSCKRNVSDSNITDEPNLEVKSLAQAKILKTEDPSAKHFKSANVTTPGGKTRKKCAKTPYDLQTLHMISKLSKLHMRADNRDDLINNQNSSKAHISKAKSLLTKNQVLRKSTQEPNQDYTNSKNVTKTKTLAAKGPISSSVKNKSCKTAAKIVDIRDDDRTNDTNQIVTSVESCVKSNVSEVRNESVAETVEASDERERASSDVTKDGICVESYVSEVQSAAEDRALAGKSYSEEPNRDVTTSEVSGCESDVEDALVEEDNDLALASFTDEPNPYGTASELQICNVWSLSAMSEHRENNPEGQAFDPDPDRELAGEPSEATNQRARGDEAGVLPRPTSSRANQELDYVVLRREENINRIRARLRRLEEKFTSRRTDENSQER